MASRPGRLKAVIARNISDIVNFELKKPSIGMVSVNEVKVNNDYSEAKVFVSFMDGKYPYQRLAELKATEGYVRSSLAKKMDVYNVPKITFYLDESLEDALHLDEVLAKEEETHHDVHIEDVE